MVERNHDIFISYRNDGVGQNFAARLEKDLTDAGYSVYFNPNEMGATDFPERLRRAITHCTDFIAIVTKDYLKQLSEKKEQTNWIQKEVLIAHASRCKITPLLVNGATMPSEKTHPSISDYPDNLKFFAGIDAITMPDQYMATPFLDLKKAIEAYPDKDDVYKHIDNSNPAFQIKPELKAVSKTAQEGNAQAMIRAALMYYYGLDGRREYDKAEQWLRKVILNEDAAPEQIALAENLLSHMYYSGQIAHESQSYQKSYEYHSRAAEVNANSHAELAFAQRFGIGCPFDYAAIERQYREAVKSGSDAVEHLELGNFYETYGEWAEAADQYKTIIHISREAAYRLGLLYKKGVLTDPPCPDYSSAANLFKPLVYGDHPHAEAAYELGMCFARPTGAFPLNFVKAAELFKIAVENGHTESAYMLGWICENNLAGPNIHNRELALRYYTIAADKGHSLAALQLSLLYQEKSGFTNYHKAYRYAVMASNGGVAEADLILGNLLLLGRGCEPDEDCAYRHYFKASESGVYAGEEMMGLIQDKIKERATAKEEVERAIDLYDSAVESDWNIAFNICTLYSETDGKAANLLGLMYHNGQGVIRNDKKAFEFYKKAEDMKYRAAYYNLADAYYFGLGVEQDYKMAAEYYKKCANEKDENGEGDHDAEAAYGRMLRLGLGVVKDLEQAKDYLLRASPYYIPLAKYDCALCYEEEKDYTRALHWFTRAAECHMSGAAERVGIYYRDGLGMDKPDPEEAEKWFRIARESGSMT